MSLITDKIIHHPLVSIHSTKTWLFVPATKLTLIAKAFASGADAVIVDLEDTVAQKDKASARAALSAHYHSKDYQPIWLRLNKAGTEAFTDDLALCQQLPKLAGVILSKAEQAADIESLYQATGLPVIALIETALGLSQLQAMAKATGLVAFSYGFLDLCHDLGVQVETPAADIVANQIRYQLVVTSKAQQLSAPIDSVYPNFNDEKGLFERVKLWSQMGLSGMLCIHPKQVATVRQALKPTAAALDFAKRVLAEYEHSGQAVFQIDAQMIDAPVIERCRLLVAAATAL